MKIVCEYKKLVIAKKKPRNTTSIASRFIFISSTFRHSITTSNVTPTSRPNKRRYSRYAPAVTAIASAAITHQAGARNPRRAIHQRHAPADTHTAVTHQGRRVMCGAITKASAASSQVMLFRVRAVRLSMGYVLRLRMQIGFSRLCPSLRLGWILVFYLLVGMMVA